MTTDDEKPPTPDEEVAARELAQALDGEPVEIDPDDRAAATRIRAAAGIEAPLGELRARGLVRAALAVAVMQRRRRRDRIVGALAIAACLALMLGLWRRPSNELPQQLCSRSAGMLAPGPFPSLQTAAQRLDAVAGDRLVAFREVRLRRLARRPQ